MNSQKRFSALLTALLALTVLLGGMAFAQSSTKKAKDKSATTTQTQSGEKVDLNSASESDLNNLPGVGPATTKKIIAGRPYSSVDDLKKAGLSVKQIDKLRDLTTVSGGATTTATSKPSASTPAPTSSKKTKETSATTAQSQSGAKVDLNTASETDLNNLPGIGPATTKKIIAGRPYSSVDDLKKAGVSAKQIEKIRDVATVSGSAGSSTSAKAAASTPAPTQPTPPATASKGQMRTEEKQSTASAGMPQRDAGTTTPPAAGSGQVWVNLDTKVYHKEGDRWYGKTKNGKYMSEADAQAAGYRAAKK